MLLKEFISRVLSLDSSLKLVPGPNAASGIYKRSARHPDANKGLVWVAAVPSPSHFYSIREKDWFKEGGEYVRGWMNVLCALRNTNAIPECKIDREFGKDWKTPGRHGVMSKAGPWNEPTQMQKHTKAIEDIGRKHGVALA